MGKFFEKGVGSGWELEDLDFGAITDPPVTGFSIIDRCLKKVAIDIPNERLPEFARRIANLPRFETTGHYLKPTGTPRSEGPNPFCYYNVASRFEKN